MVLLKPVQGMMRIPPQKEQDNIKGGPGNADKKNI
jgi:hypothetical protein